MFGKWNHALRQWLDDDDFRENRRIRLVIYIALAALLYAVLLGSILPARYEFAIGQTSPVTIVAPTTAVNSLATEESRQAAVDKVPKQYVQSPEVEQDALATLDTLFKTATQVVADKTMNATMKLESISAFAPKGVSQSTLQILTSRTPNQIAIIQNVSYRIVKDLLDAPFNQGSESQASLLVDREMLRFDLDRVSRLVVQDLVVSVLKPNMVYQDAATQSARNAARRAVPDMMIHQGDVIVTKNGIVTADVQSKLKDVGLYSNQLNYSKASGFALFVVISVGLLAAYIERRGPRRKLDNLMLVILSLVLILMAVILSITKGIVDAGGPVSIEFLVPISVGAMLVTVLMDSSIAIVASFYLSLFFGAALGFDYWMAFIGFLSSLVGAYSVSKVTHRGTFMRAGFLVAAVNVVAVIAMHLLQEDNGLRLHAVSLRLGFAAVNGIVSAILTMGILPFLESAFGLLTAIRLLELSNPNNPLLHKVLMEAPGSYHHSLIVGNLAEAAAEIVGADPLLCRVGAYYHDVGKTRRPSFFVENQMTKDNPHDKIAPSLSHLIITSHVSDGLDMLEKAGLPRPIRDICASHHGTTILWYFYNKAREADKNGTVQVNDYRYQGPKPKTRECAIIMICDAVEAAVRSMSRPTPNRVEGVIRKIIRDRLQDGQLDECDLTLQDLDVMVGAFMKTLKGIYHSRIEYPDVDKIRKEVGR